MTGIAAKALAKLLAPVMAAFVIATLKPFLRYLQRFVAPQVRAAYHARVAAFGPNTEIGYASIAALVLAVALFIFCVSALQGALDALSFPISAGVAGLFFYSYFFALLRFRAGRDPPTQSTSASSGGTQASFRFRCDHCGAVSTITRNSLVFLPGIEVPRIRCSECGSLTVFGGGQLFGSDGTPQPASPATAVPTASSRVRTSVGARVWIACCVLGAVVVGGTAAAVAGALVYNDAHPLAVEDRVLDDEDIAYVKQWPAADALDRVGDERVRHLAIQELAKTWLVLHTLDEARDWYKYAPDADRNSVDAAIKQGVAPLRACNIAKTSRDKIDKWQVDSAIEKAARQKTEGESTLRALVAAALAFAFVAFLARLIHKLGRWLATGRWNG